MFLRKHIWLLLLLFLFCKINIAQSNHQYVLEHNLPNPQLNAEYEHELTKDPATGMVPRERLLEGMKLIEGQQSMKVLGPIPGLSWKERGPKNQPGRMRSVILDPNDGLKQRVFAASVAGGLWRCNNITASTTFWTPVNDFFANLAVTTIAFDPTNNQIAYFGTGEGYTNTEAIRGMGIWKSTDGGTTWAQLPSTNNATFYFNQKILVYTNGDVYAATSAGLQKSTDGGLTWTKVLGAGTGAVSDVISDIEFANNGTIFASCGIIANDGMYSSPSGNAGTWTKLNTAASGFTTNINVRRIEIATAPSNANIIYAMPCKFTAGKYRTDTIYVSGNQGLSWTPSSLPIDANPNISTPRDITNGLAYYTMMLEVDPNNSTVIWVGGINLYRSNDGGVTYYQASDYTGTAGYADVHACQHDAYFEPGNSNVVLFANDGGIYRTTNATFTTPAVLPRNDNLNNALLFSSTLNPTSYDHRIWAGTENNVNMKLNNPGIGNGNLINLGGTGVIAGNNGGYYHVDYNNQANHVWTSTNLTVPTPLTYYYRSTDGGLSNSYIGNKQTLGPFNITAYDSIGKNIYTSWAANSQYFVWAHSATTIPAIAKSFAALSSSRIRSIAVSPNLNTTVYFGLSNGKLIKALNAPTAATFSSIGDTTFPVANISCIVVEPGNENHIIVTFSNYGVASVWETTNAGATWTNIEGNLPDMPVRWAMFNPINPTQFLLATELGVWTTDALAGAATQWFASNTGLANMRCDMLNYRPSDGLMLVATHGRGVFSSDVFTGVEAAFTSDKRITYTNKGIQFYDASYKASSFLWNFGDATTSTLQNPLKSYTNPGVYAVSLTINSGGSSVSKTNYIKILPNRVAPYLYANGGDFETNPNDFGSDNEDIETPWELGNSAVPGKDGTLSGVNAWVTGITQPTYQTDEEISLLTPNFDLTGSVLWNLEFYSKFNTENGYDGFIVEYSLDKGDNWSPLGNYQVPNWYNNQNNITNTSFPINQAYFSSDTVTVYNRCFWGISSLAGNLNVAFRIRFKAFGDVTNLAGVAVDNFQIFIPDPLAASLLSFTGKHYEKYNALMWNISSRNEVISFHIERSADGVNFEHIYTLSAGNQTSYSFNDYNLIKNKYFYRIVSSELSGKNSYSKVIALGSKIKNTASLVVTPNPTNDLLFIMADHVAGTSTLNIINANGKLMLSKKVDNPTHLSQGISTRELNMTPGIYFIQLVTEDESLSTKLVVK
ncbi:MAG: T9SS type A sorting domain-containing protein [Bacteroidetes bacterium]|nr:T9SS type A sorting domain-containing protein [Bacteroidota bacterium]